MKLIKVIKSVRLNLFLVILAILANFGYCSSCGKFWIFGSFGKFWLFATCSNPWQSLSVLLMLAMC